MVSSGFTVIVTAGVTGEITVSCTESYAVEGEAQFKFEVRMTETE